MSRVIKIVHPAPCMTCEEQIATGTVANWEHHVGIWHLDCLPPVNLQFYINARDRGSELQRRVGQ